MVLLQVLKKMHTHPNVIQYFSSFMGADGCYFVVIEYANGGDLHDFVQNCQKIGKSLDEATVQDLVLQILSGLNHMHSQNILHRDLKPRNIFLHQDDAAKKMVAKIGDFGISKVLEHTNAMANTSVGKCARMLVWTPEAHPLSQSQARSVHHDNVAQRSLLYSPFLACML